jgi:E3 ubiquitin-protein ligase UBR7
MFQCLGLGTAEEGGCGEDWYHTGCIVGLGPTWYEDQELSKNKQVLGSLETITEDETAEEDEGSDDNDIPHAPGFPNEDDFEGFICYKCVDANPWIKRYAGTQGFLAPVFKRSPAPSPEADLGMKINPTETKAVSEIFPTPIPVLNGHQAEGSNNIDAIPLEEIRSEQQTDPIEIKTASETFDMQAAISRKRKASEEEEEEAASSKRFKEEVQAKPACKHEELPPAPEGTVSLFFKSDFRDHLCRCSDCFPRMAKHAQLLDEEEAYEPPVSEDGDDGEGSTVGSGSLLDRGERALTNVDRVRAIEGVMAYNHLKEKLKPFFKEFAESGKAISAEDIKAHFAKIRGDEEAIKQAGEAAANSGDNRREQSGY